MLTFDRQPKTSSGYLFSDKFCGGGGSSSGLRRAGLQLRIALNHWDKAIETHAANFDGPGVDHRCVDINKLDKRSLPRTHILWASPICTEESPGGGNKRRKKPPSPGQLMLEEEAHVPEPGHERTRATFWDVIQATEVNRYEVVIVENVVEAYTKWELMHVWIAAMKALGYDVQVVSVNAAHVGDQDDNDPAPQWRDRIYFFCVRKDLTAPRISPSPRSWCFQCQTEVDGVQWFKPWLKTNVGKYRDQYLYRCPNAACRHSVVEPFVLPAAAAVDWTDIGIRIGDRQSLGMRKLAKTTLRRIEVGRDLITEPYLASIGHDSARLYPAASRPLATRTGKIGDGLVVPGSYIATLRNNVLPQNVATEPLRTVAAGGNHHAFVVPGAFIQKHHGGMDYTGVGHMVKDPLTDPMPVVVAKPNISLVIPFRQGSTPAYAIDRPISTVATREAHGIAVAPDTAADLDDFYFRMISWREAANAQRFERDYVFTGNKSENTMMAGNAVAANCAQWLGGIAIDVLDGVG